MAKYIDAVGGYLSNPEATSDCLFCSSRTTDQFLERSFNIDYGHRWRNTGIILGVTVFNVRLSFGFWGYVDIDKLLFGMVNRLRLFSERCTSLGSETGVSSTLLSV